MIVSYLHNFIFIKTRKTAGTSVELTFTPQCGPDDVLTPIALTDELVRARGTILQARNYCGDATLTAEFEQAVRQCDGLGVYRIHQKLQDGGHFYNHMTAAEVRHKLPPAFWNSALKFTVERHPYEKAVSLAYFRRQPTDHFPAVLDLIVQGGEYDDFPRYSIDDRIVVDEIMRQENLEADLKRVGARLGIAIPNALPRAKSSTRRDHRPAREILSNAQKRIVFERCRRTFEVMGYEP